MVWESVGLRISFLYIFNWASKTEVICSRIRTTSRESQIVAQRAKIQWIEKPKFENGSRGQRSGLVEGVGQGSLGELDFLYSTYVSFNILCSNLFFCFDTSTSTLRSGSSRELASASLLSLEPEGYSSRHKAISSWGTGTRGHWSRRVTSRS